MTRKQERALVADVVGRLWPKQWMVTVKSGRRVAMYNDWYGHNAKLDMNLAGEVMKRMKKHDWLLRLICCGPEWSAQFFSSTIADVRPHTPVFLNKRPELAILLAAQAALKGLK